jgi:hypothetical protein
MYSPNNYTPILDGLRIYMGSSEDVRQDIFRHDRFETSLDPMCSAADSDHYDLDSPLLISSSEKKRMPSRNRSIPPNSPRSLEPPRRGSGQHARSSADFSIPTAPAKRHLKSTEYGFQHRILPCVPQPGDFATLDRALQKAVCRGLTPRTTEYSQATEFRCNQEKYKTPSTKSSQEGLKLQARPHYNAEGMDLQKPARALSETRERSDSSRPGSPWSRIRKTHEHGTQTKKTALRKMLPIPSVLQKMLPEKRPQRKKISTSSITSPIPFTSLITSSSDAILTSIPDHPEATSSSQKHIHQETCRRSSRNTHRGSPLDRSKSESDCQRISKDKMDAANKIELVLSALAGGPVQLSPEEPQDGEALQRLLQLLQDNVSKILEQSDFKIRVPGRPGTQEMIDILTSSDMSVACSPPRSFSTLFSNGIYELDAGLPRHLSRGLFVSKSARQEVPANVSDTIILQILQQVNCLQDLLAMAVVNRLVYTVFKRHELELVQSTLWKTSPAAWELCHISIRWDGNISPAKLADAPKLYLQHYSRNTHTAAKIKALLLTYCKTLLRPESVRILSGKTKVGVERFDEALFRVWTFCQLFGSGKDRECDIVGQEDWVRGGTLARQQGQTSAAFLNLYDFNSVLFDPPDGFGEGNRGGLTLDIFDDMIEIWKCLEFLIHFLHKDTVRARRYGIFDEINLAPKDRESEEHLLSMISLSNLSFDSWADPLTSHRRVDILYSLTWTCRHINIGSFGPM